MPLRQLIAGLSIALCVWNCGCTQFRLRQSLHEDPPAWPMYGGSMERRNVSSESLAPPFEQIWEYDASAGFASQSAVAADSFIFAANLLGEVHAVHVRTGDRSGEFDFGASIIGAPVIQNGILYVALTRETENLIAYDLTSGKVLWKSEVGDVESSPLLVGNHLYVTTLSGKLVAVETKSGESVWSYELPRNSRTSAIHSSPASDGETIVFGSDDGVLYAVGLDGKERWKIIIGAPIMAAPSIYEGRVFVGALDDTFYAFNLLDGKLLWKKNLGSHIYASQSVDASALYVGTSGGVLCCLDQVSGEIVWQRLLNSVIGASPLVSDTLVYVGCLDKHVYVLSSKTGEQLWRYSSDARVKTTPLIVKGYLVVLREDRTIIGFRRVTQ